MKAVERHGFFARRPSGPPLPPGLGTIQWLIASALRLPWATGVALICAWSAVVVSLWAAILDGLGSVVVLFLGGGAIGATGSIIAFSSHTAGGLTFLAIFVAFGFGVSAGFLDAYTSSVSNAIPAVAAALLVGSVIALLLGLVLTNMEPRLLALRGYRRASQREWDGHLLPAMQEVVDAMKLPCSPKVLVADSPVPNAWAHSRHIVVTTGLIKDLDQAELTAVIAHEVMHWRQGDPLALRLVWCFGWPVVVMFAAGMWISGGGPQMQRGGAAASSAPQSDARSTLQGTRSVVAVIGWFFLWPSWLLIRFVMVPAVASESRRIEYEADAGAAGAGFGPPLHKALERLAPFEGGRSAWEAALSATHPPMELRLEALDHHEYYPPQPVKMPSTEEVVMVLGLLLFLLVVILQPLILSGITKLLHL